MLPRLASLEWGAFIYHLNGYGFSAFLGTAAALIIVLRRARASALPLQPLLWVLMLSVAGAFAGARLAFALQYGRSPLAGGWVLYGGLIGGVLTSLASGRRFGLPALAVADVSVPCMMLAAAFGRVGCFFAGCCHGAVWDGGVAYPAFSHAWHAHVHAGLIGLDADRSLPTVPAPLLEAGALLAFFVATSLVWRGRPRPGTPLAACGLLYSVWRFGAEFWRGDHAPYWGQGLTFSQGVSLVVFAGSLLLLRRRSRTAPVPPASRHTRLVAGQVASILVGVAALCGSIGCSAKDRHEVADSCIQGCIDDCADECSEECQECCAESCRSEREEPPPDEPEGSPPPAAFRVPRLEPGSRHSGRISMRGTLNERLDVALDLAGDLQALSKDTAGTLLLRLEIRELRVTVGNLSLPHETGWLELNVDAKGRTVLRTTTLPQETLSILKSVEPLTKGFFRVEFPAEPSADWTERIDRELQVPDPRGTMRGTVEIDGESQAFHASALVTQTANGDKKVNWMFRR